MFSGSKYWIRSLIALTMAASAHGEDPWADSVVSNNAINPNPGFDHPAMALGEPVAGTLSAPNNASLHSIGTPGSSPGSYITLKFDSPIVDDPLNPMGLDFIVYGNAFWVGGNSSNKWIEAGLVEVSADANMNGQADDPWYVIPGSRNYAASVLPAGIANPNPSLAGFVTNSGSGGSEGNWGYADLSPTQQKYLDNYVRPDDPLTVGNTSRSGGGDAFDIAWAVDGSGQAANLTQIDFVRVSAFLLTPGGFIGSLTPEIDAIADVAANVDTDGDEILDEYETRVSGTDPSRPESTVLALEIPIEEGGSASGTSLGTAADDSGNAIELTSSGSRSGTRNYNVHVDILDIADPASGITIPGLRKSTAARDFVSSESDFQAAQIQDAIITIAYTASEVSQVDESTLQPYRFTSADFVQTGMSSILVDTTSNTVTFRSRYPGEMILAGVELPEAGADIFVSFGHAGVETGDEETPWNTFGEAITAATAGDTIRFDGNSDVLTTPETYTGINTISKRMRLTVDPSGGPIRIGVATTKANPTPSTSTSFGNSDRDSNLSETRNNWIDILQERMAQPDNGAEAPIYLDRTTHARVLPLSRRVNGVPTVGNDGAVALRLLGTEELGAQDIWADGLNAANYSWQQTPYGGWIIGSPSTAWSDVLLSMRVGVRGNETVEASAEFRVDPNRSRTIAGPHVEALTHIMPPVGAIGEPLLLGPDSLFESPLEFAVPLPDDLPLNRIEILYLQQDKQDFGWYRAQHVGGWLASPARVVVGEQGARIILTAQHSAVIQIVDRAALSTNEE